MAKPLTPQYYLSNAREMLSAKAEKQGNHYGNVKYVQTASGTAYLAVLLAIDRFLQQKEGAKFVKPRSIEEYRSRVGKHSRKLLDLLNEAYDMLHLVGYYHGTTSVTSIQNGLKAAEKVIEMTE
ncbi:hypothetical protein BWI97_14340 [Siphonobacter sp. BAB-5405]|uniref:DUF5618 family protein n=1 Tax=Siphonobacter sp. BAB-5405 TaxID=1864825 RepID=UPI000C809A5D|nr:DUF5618 family protein [Siphonobacter sp. BAB-5405]PMD95531.1 hypothetical protein BWI97_14340 [Siphonobacter sp. BAB-5405]